jgi:hypothetical protein
MNLIWLYLFFTTGIPIELFIIWLEINKYGQTNLPEIYTGVIFTMYVMWRLTIWKLMLEIRRHGSRKDIM